jgi:hypothetical protein
VSTVEKVILEGIVRGGASDGLYSSVRLNPQGELLTAQGLPPFAEMTRRGFGWQGMTTAGVAGLVVRPSTVALFTLWNGDATKSLIIDRAWCFNLVSKAAAAYWSIWGCVHPAGMTKPTADITAIKSMSGKTAYTGAAVIDADATVVDNGWFPLSNQGASEPTGVLPSGTMIANIDGRLILPPTAGFSLQVVTSNVAETFTTGCSWYELYIPINE